MIKQTLMFTTPVSLSLKNEQLIITRKDTEETVSRPIEDIGFVVVANQLVKMSVPLLNALSDNNVSVIICDEKQMPKSMLMTLDGNTTLQESYRYQMNASGPMKKRLWKQIVEAKIKNQSTLLNKAEQIDDILKPYYLNVKSGDTDNREGAAARIYWSCLFGKDFRRERDGVQPNAMLNYGYTILRAAVARALVGSGLYPAFGIFHRNRYNAFPLADDIMEPYRPFVDEIVYHLYMDGAKEELDKMAKGELLKVLASDVRMGKITRPLEVALSITTSSLLKVYKGDETKLILPTMT
ncbi:MAG: type II CRISPR-associated endonuclease Cas1 [Bacteroidaceae bacterium]|nr:type II CRISPR-associated endonuclease Cas1 [Bacteroidaceae bacterium]